MNFPQIQKLLDDNWPGWEPVRLIGRGAFGSVYEIRKNIGGKIEAQALKVISVPEDGAPLPMGRDKQTLQTYYSGIAENMKEEYKKMRSLVEQGCANVVNCDDYIAPLNPDGLGYKVLIRMELLTDLNTYIRLHGATRQAVIRLGIDICRALETCRKLDLTHRDIKPANLFVAPDGTFKLGDFGVAKKMEETGYAGSKQGTILYMAPEVYQGQYYDKRVDQYSLGLVLYQLMNQGRLPFESASLDSQSQTQALKQRMRGDLLPLPMLESGALAQVVCRACAFRKEDRFAGPTEMRMALEDLLNPADCKCFLDPVEDLDQEVQIRFLCNGELLQAQDCRTGARIEQPKIAREVERDGKWYRFLGWEPELPETATMTMDYTAVYQETEKKPEPDRKKPGSGQKTPGPDRKKLLLAVSAAAVLLAALLAVFLLPRSGGKLDALALDPAELAFSVGETGSLTLESMPEDYVCSDLTWTSSDEAVATVDSDGSVTAHGPGVAIILAESEGKQARCRVIVSASPEEEELPKEPQVVRMDLDTTNAKTEYYLDEDFDDSGLELDITYSDGVTHVVRSGFTSDFDSSVPGRCAVTVFYEGEAVGDYKVTVKEAELESIRIVNLPVTTLQEGESLNLSGLTIEAAYSDGSREIVSEGEAGLSCSPTAFSSVGSHTVTVSYGGQTDTFDVEVAQTERFQIAVSSSNSKYGSVTGGGTFKKGEKATLTASEKSGCLFKGWSDGYQEKQRTIVADQNASLTAIFYGPVSGWSVNAPTGAHLVETGTQYRYRDKETAMSTTEVSQNGWTLKKTENSYGPWSETRQTDQRPAENDLLRITNQRIRQYALYHYCSYYDGHWNVDSCWVNDTSHYCLEYYDTLPEQTKVCEDKGGRASSEYYTPGHVCSGYHMSVWWRSEGDDQYTYDYQTRELVTNYYYERYSDWSSWSFNPASESSTRQVETRTVLRYREE